MQLLSSWAVVYLQEESQAFREQYVAKWILHTDNLKRAEIISEIQD